MCSPDAATGAEEESGGVIVSNTDLVVTGNGSLEIAANRADGILGKNDLWIDGGAFTITAADDAITAERNLVISAGIIDIVESVEGIEAPIIVINGGTIKINSSDDGINASDSDLVADGLSITFNGGDITVNGEVVTELANQFAGENCGPRTVFALN